MEGRPTGPAQSGRVGKVLEQRRQAEEGRRQSLGLETETPIAIPPTEFQVALSFAGSRQQLLIWKIFCPTFSQTLENHSTCQ